MISFIQMSLERFFLCSNLLFWYFLAEQRVRNCYADGKNLTECEKLTTINNKYESAIQSNL